MRSMESINQGEHAAQPEGEKWPRFEGDSSSNFRWEKEFELQYAAQAVRKDARQAGPEFRRNERGCEATELVFLERQPIPLRDGKLEVGIHKDGNHGNSRDQVGNRRPFHRWGSLLEDEDYQEDQSDNYGYRRGFCRHARSSSDDGKLNHHSKGVEQRSGHCSGPGTASRQLNLVQVFFFGGII